jgi:hypothetical protein
MSDNRERGEIASSPCIHAASRGKSAKETMPLKYLRNALKGRDKVCRLFRASL